MKLLGRTTRPTDLDRCLELVRDRFLYDDAALVDLKAMWQSVIDRDVGRSAVVFESDRPERVLAFGVSAAVSDARLASIVANAAPFIGRSLLDAWRLGDDPFLDEPSFAKANARDGLSVVVIHNGFDETIEPRFLPDALSVMSENFVNMHTGSNLKIVMHEAFGIPADIAIDLGMRITRYSAGHEALIASVPPDRTPIITTMTRAYAEQHPGNLVMAQTFLRFSPPQCDLSGAERRLLRLALEGTPDDVVADVLQIAPRTLKKRWADVYARMERVTGIAPGGGGGRRGAEIRRHVLRYVRQHPEEMHAYDATQRRAKVTM